MTFSHMYHDKFHSITYYHFATTILRLPACRHAWPIYEAQTIASAADIYYRRTYTLLLIIYAIGAEHNKF